MSTPHQQLPPRRLFDGWQWRCSCGTRGHVAPDKDTARRLFILHRERMTEPVQ